MADPKKSAIILVDVARDFIEPGGTIADSGGPEYIARAKAIVPHLKALIEGARAKGATVLYSSDEHTDDDLELRKWPPHAMKGTKWAEIVDDLAVQPGDLNFPKTTYSGFQCTNMESVLRARGIDTLYITGLHTDCCCRHTSGDAFQRGFNLVWVTDCLDALTPAAHQAGLDYFRAYYATEGDTQFQTAQDVLDSWS
ncbi:isochorismatase (2,3 dihydro-2,3 dihydroxybenzoatesynthase) (Superoxide-inducible protein 1) [Ketogulonicigenium robustum]|uniref:Isochorismatase (2,3 dihydro-2,3 dihydroxybenzoatesynthase) (Superoxide-inducible protein 1) n=1 Tax=Ketogulonicigenium robustum TaxID=92947 RepID=A0A1W6P2E3_9RHOB|nr:isochorismatase family cysteine hydrolase [Ketogulonicigenium robustum]ARO15685.1 isochorismatase (2,3 dihydro-2,3 dihydroxybenzoatesynthase) (Superoxide-inducible protein 1) [Ketogulonicigenium robustum]